MKTPIESRDPGEKPLPGGILFARYGKGAYIYTSTRGSASCPPAYRAPTGSSRTC